MARTMTPHADAPPGARVEPPDTAADDSPVNTGEAERWLSIAGGALLAVGGLRARGIAGFALAALGGGLIWRGVTGTCQVYRALGIDRSGEHPSGAGPRGLVERRPLYLEASVTIDQPADTLYARWRDFERLPRMLSGVQSVEVENGGGRSHWHMHVAPGIDLDFDAILTADEEDRCIAWAADEEDGVDHRGCVTFRPLGHGRGTEVRAEICYQVPGGGVGQAIADKLDVFSAKHLEADLRRFKREMETGSVHADGARSEDADEEVSS